MSGKFGDGGLANHLADTSDAHDASAISVLDSGANYTATDVEGVLAEIAPQLGGGGYFDATVVKTATESVTSSTTLQNDDELSFSVVANTSYYIEVILVYDSPAGGGTPDIKTQFALAAGAFVSAQVFGVGVSNAEAATTQNVFNTAIVWGTGTTPRVLRLEVFVRADTTTTLHFQWAQNVSGVNATRVLAGSTLSYRALD